MADDGLVEVKLPHGMMVLPISPGDMRDVYDVIASLEATAAEPAIEKGVDPDEIKRLNETLDQMERALRDEDRVAWVHGDEEFHRLLVQCSGADVPVAGSAVFKGGSTDDPDVYGRNIATIGTAAENALKAA